VRGRSCENDCLAARVAAVANLLPARWVSFTAARILCANAIVIVKLGILGTKPGAQFCSPSRGLEPCGIELASFEKLNQAPSSGDCVNRLAQLPFPKEWNGRSIIRWQHRLKRETPNLHRARIALKECGWKGGDSGGSAGEQLCRTKKRKNPLDSDRPSHGRQ
jgi:hypothetical protein